MYRLSHSTRSFCFTASALLVSKISEQLYRSRRAEEEGKDNGCNGKEDGIEVTILPMTAFTHTDTQVPDPDCVNTNL